MAKNGKPDFWDWIGINTHPDFSKNRWVGRAIGFAASAFILLLFMIASGLIIWLLKTIFFPQQATNVVEDIRNLGLAAAAVIGVPFLVWRSIVAQKQVDVAEQGHITDRINKAVEGLGTEKEVNKLGRDIGFRIGDQEFYEFEWKNKPYPLPEGAILDPNLTSGWRHAALTEPNLEVRIGAIYALERISQDSERDHIQIMEILCAYIRQNAPADSLAPTPSLTERAKPRADIQAAITVLGRRSRNAIKLEAQNRYRLDLTACDLSGIDFSSGNFSGAKIWDSRLEACLFEKADLTGTRFFRSLLNRSSFHETTLIGARFDHITGGGHLFRANDRELSKGVCVAGADLSEMGNFPSRSFMKNNITFGDKDTKLPHHNARKYETAMGLKEEASYAQMDGDASAASEKESELRKTGFYYWSEFGSDDGATYIEMNKFFKAHNLTDWPYQDD